MARRWEPGYRRFTWWVGGTMFVGFGVLLALAAILAYRTAVGPTQTFEAVVLEATSVNTSDSNGDPDRRCSFVLSYDGREVEEGRCSLVDTFEEGQRVNVSESLTTGNVMAVRSGDDEVELATTRLAAGMGGLSLASLLGGGYTLRKDRRGRSDGRGRGGPSLP